MLKNKRDSMIKQLTFLTLILLTTSCSDNDSIQTENFVGNWTATQVLYDGALKTEWAGTHLTFEQNKIDGGLYSMTDTRYDSIWSSNGTWKKSNEEFKLILDDTLTVSISSDSKNLNIVKWLPWTAQSTCDSGTGICLPVVTGMWHFKFERRE
jgi:hypothetical protein